jgi:hypothetical protein
MAEEWRSVEVLKLLRQCVICPFCGALVATQAGIDSHVQWHNNLDQYVANVDARLEQFADYIVDPETGIQFQIQDRLDTITQYVINPVTGLEKIITDALTQTNGAVTQLRNDAVGAIEGLTVRVTTIETEVTKQPGGIWARLSALEMVDVLPLDSELNDDDIKP